MKVSLSTPSYYRSKYACIQINGLADKQRYRRQNPTPQDRTWVGVSPADFILISSRSQYAL